MTQPLPWEKNAAVPVPPAPEPVPLDAYTAPAAPEPELVPLDIYDAPAPAPKPAKPLVDIDSLNPAQREAVLSTEGPLLVARRRRLGQDPRLDLPHRTYARRPGC